MLSASCINAALHGSRACSRADRGLVLGYAFTGWLLLLSLLGAARCLLAVNRARRHPGPVSDQRPKLHATSEARAELPTTSETEAKAKLALTLALNLTLTPALALTLAPALTLTLTLTLTLALTLALALEP